MSVTSVVMVLMDRYRKWTHLKKIKHIPKSPYQIYVQHNHPMKNYVTHIQQKLLIIIMTITMMTMIIMMKKKRTMSMIELKKDMQIHVINLVWHCIII